MTDYEPALYKTFLDHFEEIEIRGCNFHFAQCVWRKIQTFPDVRARYVSEPDFSRSVRQLLALAFVPSDNVIDSFEKLMDTSFFLENEDILRPLVNYFEDTWIGRPNRRGERGRPRFSIEHWNHYAATGEDLPRTNNAVEGWHRGFASLLAAKTPTIWKLIDALKNQQNLNTLKILQLIGGVRPVQASAKYKRVADAIKTVVGEYGKRDLEEYLIGIAQHLHMHVT